MLSLRQDFCGVCSEVRRPQRRRHSLASLTRELRLLTLALRILPISWARSSQLCTGFVCLYARSVKKYPGKASEKWDVIQEATREHNVQWSYRLLRLSIERLSEVLNDTFGPRVILSCHEAPLRAPCDRIDCTSWWVLRMLYRLQKRNLCSSPTA